MRQSTERLIRIFGITASAWNFLWFIITLLSVGGERALSDAYYHLSNIPLKIGTILILLLMDSIYIILGSPIWAAPFLLCLAVRAPWKVVSNVALCIILSFTVSTILMEYQKAQGIDFWFYYYLVESAILTGLITIKVAANK